MDLGFGLQAEAILVFPSLDNPAPGRRELCPSVWLLVRPSFERLCPSFQPVSGPGSYALQDGQGFCCQSISFAVLWGKPDI